MGDSNDRDQEQPMELDALEEFNRRADEVLHYLWDPIGVAGEVMACDEYMGYVPKLRRGTTVHRRVTTRSGHPS
jgi:hypothetical protein